MSFWLNRRRFMQTTTSVFAVGALSSVASRASAQSSGELTVVVGGGAWAKANMEAYVEPFQAETGIKVNTITDELTSPQLELMVTNNNVTIDVADLGPGTAIPAFEKGLLEKIDYSIYKKEELDAIVDFGKQQFGVASLFYSLNMVYNSETYPAGKPRPATWAELWDVNKFPGVRILASDLEVSMRQLCSRMGSLRTHSTQWTLIAFSRAWTRSGPTSANGGRPALRSSS